MGSGSTSRPSARTPASASSHITLESQSKNWIFIWLTLSTLQVGRFQSPPPPQPPFHFTRWRLICLLLLFFSKDTRNRPHWRARPAQGGGVSGVPFTFFCFPPRPRSLFFLLRSLAPLPAGLSVHLPLWSTHLTPKALQVSGLGPGCPGIIRNGESWW